MKRLVYLAMAALMALVIVVPTATAQEMMDESMMMDESNMMDESMMEQLKMEQPKMMKGNMEKGKMETPMTSGPATLSMLLPAAATLLPGSGALTYAVLRRR